MPLHLATSHPAFKGKLQEHKALMQVPPRHAIQLSSQMSVRNDAVRFIFNTDRDPTKQLLKTEIYLSSFSPSASQRQGKRGCIAGLFGIIDRNRTVQEAESFMVTVRYMALKSPPTWCSGGSLRTSVQRFSGIPALEKVCPLCWDHIQLTCQYLFPICTYFDLKES